MVSGKLAESIISEVAHAQKEELVGAARVQEPRTAALSAPKASQSGEHQTKQKAISPVHSAPPTTKSRARSREPARNKPHRMAAASIAPKGISDACAK